MFNNQNNEDEKKLDWMYKGPNSTVSRDEYLMGRPVDKTLEQLNEEEKQKQQVLLNIPKNRVEHECIPPSIRDFNKLVQAEQVDLSTKLQEDPLVAIKKREEETRRAFLQNPVQLKKLQKALKAQQDKKTKKKKKKKSKDSSDSDVNLDVKLTEKLLGKKNKKVSKQERQLDTILIHKFEALKDKLTESDLQDILNGKFSSTDDSSDDEKPKKAKKKRLSSSESSEDERSKHYKKKNKKHKKRDSSDESDKNKQRSKIIHKEKQRHRNRSPPAQSSSESEPDVRSRHNSRKYDSDDSDSAKPRNRNYGLVSSDGKKLPFLKKHLTDQKDKNILKAPDAPPPPHRRRAHKLTEEEKEKLRKEMMENALLRDKERAHNVKRYREKDEKEKSRTDSNFDPEFIHKQLLKSADTSSVESRIKSNLNKIQRSSRDMDRNFSRR